MYFVKEEKILKQISAWLPVILWAALIFKFSSESAPVVSAVYWQDYMGKKFGHMVLFGTLAVLIFRALRIQKYSTKKAVIWAILLATFYGSTDEFHQLFTQGRESRITDVGIDGVGACLAIFLTVRVLPRMPKSIISLAKKVEII